MNEFQIFKNEEFGEIRTQIIDGEPWFVGRDICNAFDDSNASRSMSRVDNTDKKEMQITDTLGRKQTAIFVNESGMYMLLFTMQPQKANHDGVSDAYPIEIQTRIDKLNKFKRWVTSEVLPSIRKNGGYIANQENLTPEQIVANALIVAQKIIADKDRAIEEMKPKAEFFDAVADSKTAFSMNEVSKVLGIKGYGRNNLFEFLRENKVLDRYNVPYQKYVDCGWFRVIEQKYMKNGEPQVTTKTLVYQKGVDGIRKMIGDR